MVIQHRLEKHRKMVIELRTGKATNRMLKFKSF